MKRLNLFYGLMSLTVVTMLTGCVDDKYDLNDIDTTSRLTVNDLTVPVNLNEIRLKNVINLDDNENISTIDGEYAISKKGAIAPTEFSIGRIHVNAPSLTPSIFSVATPGVAVPGIPLPALPLPHVDMQPYSFSMNNVDKALRQLKNVKTLDPISIRVTLSVPSVLTGGANSLAFQNLKIQLPWGLITDNAAYDKESGMLSLTELAADSNGKATLEFQANGLELGEKGTVENGSLGIEGFVGIESGDIQLTVNENVTLPSPIEIKAEYHVSGFDIASFSGSIDYNMESIHIDPISLSGLPDFLDSPETNLIIANPQILVSLTNPVGNWLDGHGRIILTSNFKDGQSVSYPSDVFTLSGNESNIAFCTPKTDSGVSYEYVAFDGLRNVLSNGDSGLPSSIKVDIEDINFKGDVNDFPLGDLGNASGGYEFNAPLGFGNGSVVIYETTEDGWNSEDLDKVNINNVNLRALCSTDIPVSIQLSVVPVDKNGNEIPVVEDSEKFEVPAKGQNVPVSLTIKGKNGPIRNLDGVKFRAVVAQDADNTEALGPNLFIKLDDLRVTVDGYFEKEL